MYVHDPLFDICSMSCSDGRVQEARLSNVGPQGSPYGSMFIEPYGVEKQIIARTWPCGSGARNGSTSQGEGFLYSSHGRAAERVKQSPCHSHRWGTDAQYVQDARNSVALSGAMKACQVRRLT